MKEAPIEEDLKSILEKSNIPNCTSVKILFLLNSKETVRCLDLLEQVRENLVEQIQTDQKLVADLDYMTMRIQKEV